MESKHSYVTHRGTPSPLGVSLKGTRFNFALLSQQATKITLCLYALEKEIPFLEIPLNPQVNRTGYIWHICIEGLPERFLWGYKVTSPDSPTPQLVSDPYAKKLNTPQSWGTPFYGKHSLLGEWETPSFFDWEDDAPPLLPLSDLVIYEMHVRSFTQDPSSHTKHPGSFSALTEKIPYLKELGVNAIELMPIFEFDECENVLQNPKTGKRLYNMWGYSTVNFFTLMKRYTSSVDPLSEFKTFVKELHKNKIELYLDVVYNHTAEGNEHGRTFSFRGIDKKAYYILGPKGEYYNYSGCGNTFNCNEPAGAELILDSLKYWAAEMHVDGFRFDLASILTRDPQGTPLSDPPVVKAISQDPLLANCKLIAEAWDAAGLYQVGSFPHYGRWIEWNGKYRDRIRSFIKGTDNQVADFSKALCGSQDIYGYSRTPCHSVNFITAHDGFTLRDLVSYNQKHNEENGENNQDGTNDNESWNCGKEGPTSIAKVLGLRERQMRNLHTTLLLSLGIPMVLMGDEYGHTRGGNNNAWCQDNNLNWFQWDALEKNAHFHRFFKKMIHFRRRETVFHRCSFFTAEDVDWHGTSPFHPDWSASSRFIAYTLKDLVKQNHLYIAFNAQSDRLSIQLPDPPAHKKWYRVVDTALAPPNDFIEEPEKFQPLKVTYKMEAYSVLIAKALS